MLERLVDLLGQRSLATSFSVVLAVLILCGCGLPMPEDIALVTGGVLAWLASPLTTSTLSGMLHDPGLLGMVVIGLLGILAGDSIVYFAGRRYGTRVAEFWPLRRVVTAKKLERVERLMRRKGNVVVLIARYLPGLRAPTFFAAGHSRLPYPRFLFFDGLAALVSAPFWVCLGFYFGDDIEQAAKAASELGHLVLLVVLAIVALILFFWIRRRRLRAERAAAAASEVRPGPREREVDQRRAHGRAPIDSGARASGTPEHPAERGSGVEGRGPMRSG